MTLPGHPHQCLLTQLNQVLMHWSRIRSVEPIVLQMLYVTTAISLAISVAIAPIVSKEDEAVVKDVVVVKDVAEVEDLMEVEVVRDVVGVAQGRTHGRGSHQRQVSFRPKQLALILSNGVQLASVGQQPMVPPVILEFEHPQHLLLRPTINLQSLSTPFRPMLLLTFKPHFRQPTLLELLITAPGSLTTGTRNPSVKTQSIYHPFSSQERLGSNGL